MITHILILLICSTNHHKPLKLFYRYDCLSSSVSSPAYFLRPLLVLGVSPSCIESIHLSLFQKHESFTSKYAYWINHCIGTFDWEKSVFNDQEIVVFALDATCDLDMIIVVVHWVEFEQLWFCEETVIQQRLRNQFVVKSFRYQGEWKPIETGDEVKH